MGRRGWLAALCLVWLVLPAAAEARDRLWHATLYLGQWVSPSEFTRSIGAGDDALGDGYFASVLASRVLVRELRTDLPVLGPLIDGGSIELEGQFGQHFGLQRHAEASLALLWRSRELRLPFSAMQLNLAVAEGLSYALSRPTYEGVVNERSPQKFLNYLAFEAEFSHPDWPGVSLVPRLHHRSGIFGLIAPQGSGSDFLGIGVRVRLQ
ncbi:hypothetical protein [Falsiroseomonas sp.]|uniref:hypothetical protein n=1 Tax=Falsiroseomonas sp. TaxID=2870721 RepID=UPI00356A1C49